MACRLRGGNDILLALEKELGITAGQTTADVKFSLDRITLSGCSGSSPKVIVDSEIVNNTTPENVKELISKYR